MDLRVDQNLVAKTEFLSLPGIKPRLSSQQPVTLMTEIFQILVVAAAVVMVKRVDSCEQANEPSSSMKRWEPD